MRANAPLALVITTKQFTFCVDLIVDRHSMLISHEMSSDVDFQEKEILEYNSLAGDN